MGVNDRGNGFVIDVPLLTGDLFDDGDALFLSLVREHRTLDDVTDGEHFGPGGGVGVHVDDDLASCVGLDARGVQT